MDVSLWLVFRILYELIIITSFLYGAMYGLHEWFQWLCTRKPIKLIKECSWAEPIVNVARDGGYATWHVMTCAASNAFIASTFIVSVPIMALFFSVKEEDVKKRKN